MPPPLPPGCNLGPLGRQDVTALVARAFAANRVAGDPDRLAVRLRAGAEPIADLCFAVRLEGAILASLQSWPVALEADGATHPLILIGPVAVDSTWHGCGLGGALMDAVVERLDCAAVLVGDEAYYGRWGFAAEATRGWRVEGAVERDRLLARAGGEPLPLEGQLRSASLP